MSNLSIFSPFKVASEVACFCWGSSTKQEPFLETLRKTFGVMLKAMALIGSIFTMAVSLAFLASGAVTSGMVGAYLAALLTGCFLYAIYFTFVQRNQ